MGSNSSNPLEKRLILGHNSVIMCAVVSRFYLSLQLRYIASLLGSDFDVSSFSSRLPRLVLTMVNSSVVHGLVVQGG